MIPQSFKDIVSNVENAGLLQTIAMIIFILFFLIVIYVVLNRPKKYYSEEENAPLEKDEDDKWTL
ncbi:CcoQ/FixQ family Cbb3-type cytochrome c oxidase assembly chaperone [Epilithonimonas xixisoli]|uniref:Cbb3-type cytochrome oxidase component FixQ n=1 Tax=Epilithonimonas xixisoli TaxID=1476462 RepID=A0A4R8IAA0_9FLAO|nr:CcoQ/FixQ family Cbb3-type cytochrome c oxidase assembly chaperone [Epilithonimonas xixisoli]TDX84211.1 hypothetical protein B0I22_1814 [Epilithonimonas xixisoli]